MIQIQVDEQIFLRYLTLNDSEAVLDCIKQNIIHLQKWIQWINPLSNQKQIEAFIEQQMFDIEAQKGLMLGLFYDNQFVGMVGLQNWEHQLSIAEVGFWLATNQLKKGLMTAALQRIINFGFSEMKLQKITANFSTSNINAHKLLEKQGFKLEGVLRNQMVQQGVVSNMAVMGLLQEEWKS